MHGTDPGPVTESLPSGLRLPFVLMRGGTSKAVFLRGSDLPADAGERDTTILSLFGSPDARQIDGLGGADLLTSKLAIIDPPTNPGADLDYTFAQVSITEPVVDYDINCGNISAAVGAYAVDEGLVASTDPTTVVRIHNTNTGKILEAHVPIVGGLAAVDGSYVVHGVPGSGAPIGLDFGRTAGGTTGSLFPTGNVVDELSTSLGQVAVSIVDLANLTVFFSAHAVGMRGTEGPHEVTDEQLERVAAVKAAAATRLGMEGDGLIPVPAIVSEPATYVGFGTDTKVDVDDIDLVARVVGGRPPVLHKAYPGTLAACTAVAARIPGTTVHDVVRQPVSDEINIGHTSGIMPARARVTKDHDDWSVETAVYHRTARRIAEGTAFVRTDPAARDAGD
ncbi:MAG: PrpF domain-containing protein [Acidimicrobiia bacterium]|nr:MAG: PrpF domain-containing protein [Acidimicrobiia bacterium]